MILRSKVAGCVIEQHVLVGYDQALAERKDISKLVFERI
jgi:hypothetical protein